MARKRFTRLGRLTVVVILSLAAILSVLPHQQALAAPVPMTEINPEDIRIFPGETFTFEVTFENGAASGSGHVGYGPEIEISLPTGVTFQSAQSAIFGPLTPVQLTPTIILRLPVGSYTPDQVADSLTITATASTSLPPDGQALAQPISATSRFIYGSSPVGNAPIHQSQPAEATVTPVLYIPYKDAETRFGEDETATGPNYPITYTLSADIADGATIHDMRFTEALPDNLQFTGITGVQLAAGNDPHVAIYFTPHLGSQSLIHEGPYSALPATIDGPFTPATNAPGGTLEIVFSDVVGTNADTDIQIEFEAFVPRLDTAGEPIIDETTGGSSLVSNRLTTSASSGVSGSWSIDLEGDDITTDPVDIQARDFAIQKHVDVLTTVIDNTLSPDAVVRFTLNAQISDYFSFDQIAIQDVLGDGYSFVDNSGQLVSLTENGTNLPGVPVQFADSPQDPALDLTDDAYPAVLGGGLLHIATDARPGESAGTSSGFTTLIFDVSGLTVDGDLIGQLVGGAYADTSGATGYTSGVTDDTRFTITFDALVLRNYQNDDSFVEDPSIDAFDELHNNVLLSGRVMPVTGTGTFSTETSSTTQVIPEPELSKSLVAINGAAPEDPDVIEVVPSDEVTFELRIDIPTGNLESLTLTDFLPLPVFNSTEISLFDGPCAEFPEAGVACYATGTSALILDHGPSHYPEVHTSSLENSVTFDWNHSDTFEVETPQAITVIVHFTVTVSDDPFVDGLHLTNVSLATYGNSTAQPATRTGTASLVLREPYLTIDKQVSPATVDAGDLLTYTITVTNEGGYDAYDVGILDDVIGTLPVSSYAVTSVEGFDANDNPLDSSALNTGGTDLFTGNGLIVSGPIPAEGRAVVNVTATVDTEAVPGQAYTNTSKITQYYNQPGTPPGDNFVDPSNPPKDDATFSIHRPNVTKRIVATDQDFTSGNDVAIGEIVTYEVVISIPEGLSPDAVFTDTLDAGLAFVDDSENFPFSVVLSEGLIATGNLQPVYSNPQAGDPVRDGGRVTVALGDVVNINTDNATAETITITYSAVVLNSAGNNAGTSLNNVASWCWIDSDECETDAAPNVTVREPNLIVTKSASPQEADAGDTITYTIEVKNIGDASAHAVSLVDVPPMGLTYVPDSLTQSGGTVTPTLSEHFPGVLQAEWLVFSPTDTATITYQVTVDPGLTTGTVISNEATLLWSSLPGKVPTIPAHQNNDFACERDAPEASTACKQRDVNDYLAWATADVTVSAPVQVGKKLVNISLDASMPSLEDQAALEPGQTVRIGEYVTYAITFEFPEAITPNATIADVLQTPAVDGSLVLVAATLHRNTENLVTGANPGGINAVAVDTPVTVNMVDGDNRYSLALGDVTNNNTGGEAATLTLTLHYRVTNIAQNNAGTDLSDRGALMWGTDSRIDTDPVTVRVVEPQPVVVKAAEPISTAGGEQVEFTLTIMNQSGTNRAGGFDWVVTDTLPAIYTPVADSISVDAGDTGAVVNASFSGQTLTATIDHLDPGESVDVTFRATVSPTVEFGTVIVNHVRAETTSLPGDLPGERTGDPTDPGGNINDLSDTDSVTVTVNTPNISKTIVDQQDHYAIGEVVTFQINIGVPVGTANDFQVIDNLDDGLEYVPNSANVAFPTASGSTVQNASYNAGSNTITFDLGALTVGDAGNVVITYDAVVTNVANNVDGTMLSNSVLFEYSDPNEQGSVIQSPLVWLPDPVTVGEPDVELTKSLVSSPTGVTAGDVVTWSVRLENRGNTTAYQLAWEDTIPGDVTFVEPITAVNYSIAGSGAYLNDSNIVPTIADLTISGDTISLPGLQITPGGWVEIEFSTTVDNTVQPDQVLVNTSEATWKSRPVDTGHERDGSGTPEWNDYRDSDTASLQIDASIAIDKEVNPDSYTIGQLATYRITVSLIEGTTAQLVVTDELPAGLGYESYAIFTGSASNPNPGLAASLENHNFSVNGQAVTFDFGDLVNPADGDANNDFFVIEVTARVLNVSSNQNGVELDNNASLSFRPAGASESDVVNVDPVGIGIVEPVLDITKSVDPAAQSLGDVVTFTVVVEHTADSAATAYDVRIVDVLPAGLTYIDGSAVIANGGTVSHNGQELTFNFASIADNTQVSFTYQARIDLTATVGAPLVNDAQLTWTSLPGATGEETGGRTGSDGPGGSINAYAAGDNASLTPTSAAFITIDKSVEDLTDDPNLTLSGDILEYTIVVRNTNGPVTGVVVTDPIPVGTTYVDGSLTVVSGNGTPDDSGDPLVVDIGTMGQGDQTVITFQVRVNDFTPAGTVINNTATVDSDQTVPTADEANRPVGTPLDGNLRAEKRVALTADNDNNGSINVGDQITYTISLTNTGEVELTGVTFTDVMPLGVQVVSVDGPDWDCAWTPGSPDTIDCAHQPDTLPVGKSATITIVATVIAVSSDQPTGTWVNQGTASSNETPDVPTDGNSDPNDGEQPTEFPALPVGESGAPDIDVSKSVALVLEHNADGQLNPGETIRYTITVANSGSAPATDVTLTDDIPSFTTLIAPGATTDRGAVVSPGSQPPPNQPAPVEVRVNIGTIPVGGFATVTIDLLVDEDHPVPGTVSNQAFVDYAENPGQPVPSDDPATPEDQDDPTELGIDSPHIFDPPSGFKSIDPSGYPALTWQMVWINPSNLVATNTRIVDPIPEDTTYIDGSLTCVANGASTTVNCEYDAANNQVIWEGAIAPDPGATGDGDTQNEVTIVYQTTVAPNLNEVSNQACAHWDQDGDGFIGGPGGDPDELDQVAVCTDDPATEDAGDPTFWRAPDLTIHKASEGTFVAGQLGTYTLTVSNAGAGSSFNPITVVDTLPAGLDFVSASGEGWTCTYQGSTHQVVCETDAVLAPQSTLPPVVVVVDVTSAALPSVLNTAVVDTDGDINPENDSDEERTDVLEPDTGPKPPVWDGDTDPGLLCDLNCTAGSIFFPWVANDDDFGLGPADTSITVQNLEPRDAHIFIYRGTGNEAFQNTDAWELITVAYLSSYASKTFTAAELGFAPGQGAPVGVAGYHTVLTTSEGRVIDPVAIGGYAKQAAGGEDLPYTTTADDVVDGYNAFNCLEIRAFDEWYLPIVQRNTGPGGTWNTIIRVANFGWYDDVDGFHDVGPAAVTLRFFPANDGSGSLHTGFQLQHSVNAGDTVHIDLADWVPEGWVGSVHIYSDGAIAAMADRFKADVYMLWLTTTGTNAGHEAQYSQKQSTSPLAPYVLFAPDVRLDYFGWNTGINVANLANEENNVTIQYFNLLGNATQTLNQRLAPHGMTYFYDPSQSGQNVSDQDPESDVNAGVVGSALIWSEHPVAVAVDATKYPESDPGAQVGRIQGTTYNATANIYTWQAVPLVQKGNPTTGMGATSGINIMNPNSDAAHVEVRWYNPSGFEADNFGVSGVTIPGYANGFIYTMTQHNLPNGFYGSAVVTSTEPIAATSAQVDYQVGYDGAVIWNTYNPGGFYRVPGCHVVDPHIDGEVIEHDQQEGTDITSGATPVHHTPTVQGRTVRSAGRARLDL